MPQLNFDQEIDELYKKYLKYCVENNETPIPDSFVKYVQEATMKLVAVRIAETNLHDRPEGVDTLYIAYRVEDQPQPRMSTAIVKQCGQCQSDVYVDPEMKYAMKVANAIICNVCLPEITGAHIEDIARDVMMGGDGTV